MSIASTASLISALFLPLIRFCGMSINSIAASCRARLCSAIDQRETVAIGDDVNDLPLLRSAGLGVAVANAKPDVLHAAQRVVACNNDSGVAELIEDLLRQ